MVCCFLLHCCHAVPQCVCGQMLANLCLTVLLCTSTCVQIISGEHHTDWAVLPSHLAEHNAMGVDSFVDPSTEPCTDEHNSKQLPKKATPCAGDEQHLLQMRQARLANPGATATRVELVSQGMRELVFNSTWPVVDTTATSVKVTDSATQFSTTGDTTPSTANEANDVDNTNTLKVEVESQAAIEPPDSSSPESPQANEAGPGIGPDPASSMESFVVNAASDGSDEGEIVGAVGVSKEGLVKLYVLEELPEEALTQVRALLYQTTPWKPVFRVVWRVV